MKIKQIDFKMIYEFENESLSRLCFFKPHPSRLYRVVGLPDVGNMCTELDQVLNTLCILKRNGIWYFKADAEMDIMEILLEMDIDHLFIEPDEAAWN